LERQRQIELERRKDIERQAEMWLKSKQLREYIEAVEEKAGRKVLLENEQQLEKWLTWAKDHADRIDPLKGPLPCAEKSPSEVREGRVEGGSYKPVSCTPSCTPVAKSNKKRVSVLP